MNVVQDLQAILIDALLREVTASQAEAAVARLLHVMSGDALVMSDAEDEVAAAWAAALVQRLESVGSP